MQIEHECKQCGTIFKAYPSRKNPTFCSTSCSTTYRNLTNNPTRNEETRRKISLNHIDVSGKNNPMYGRRGEYAPSYIDGRNSFTGEVYRRILKAAKREEKCEICESTEKLHVHHVNGKHNDNAINNLMYLCSKCHLNKAHEYARDGNGRFIKSTTIDLRKVVLQ